MHFGIHCKNFQGSIVVREHSCIIESLKQSQQEYKRLSSNGHTISKLHIMTFLLFYISHFLIFHNIYPPLRPELTYL